jgi:hypothetical protein
LARLKLKVKKNLSWFMKSWEICKHTFTKKV